MLSKALGNLGYQDFHQRTLSAASSATARITCFVAAPLIFVLGIPSVLIGAVAASTGTDTMMMMIEEAGKECADQCLIHGVRLEHDGIRLPISV